MSAPHPHVPLPRTFRYEVLAKINSNTAAGLLAVLLVLTGAYLTNKGLTDSGSIDLVTPFVSGSVKTGFVGVLFVFLGVLVSMAVLVKNARQKQDATLLPPQELKIRKGDIEVEWKGTVNYLAELEHVQELLRVALESASAQRASLGAPAQGEQPPALRSDA